MSHTHTHTCTTTCTHARAHSRIELIYATTEILSGVPRETRGPGASSRSGALIGHIYCMKHNQHAEHANAENFKNRCSVIEF